MNVKTGQEYNVNKNEITHLKKFLLLLFLCRLGLGSPGILIPEPVLATWDIRSEN